MWLYGTFSPFVRYYPIYYETNEPFDHFVNYRLAIVDGNIILKSAWDSSWYFSTVDVTENNLTLIGTNVTSDITIIAERL